MKCFQLDFNPFEIPSVYIRLQMQKMQKMQKLQKRWDLLVDWSIMQEELWKRKRKASGMGSKGVQLVESIVYTMTDLDRVGSHGFTVVASDSSAWKDWKYKPLRIAQRRKEVAVTQLCWNCVSLWWCQKCNFERTSLFSSQSFSICIFFTRSFFFFSAFEFFFCKKERQTGVSTQSLSPIY